MKTLRLLIQFWICLGIIGMALYFYVDQKNQVIRLRMEIPGTERELKEALEENKRIQFQIDQFQSPERLLELHRQTPYTTLKFPSVDQVMIIHREKSDEEGKKL